MAKQRRSARELRAAQVEIARLQEENTSLRVEVDRLRGNSVKPQSKQKPDDKALEIEPASNGAPKPAPRQQLQPTAKGAAKPQLMWEEADNLSGHRVCDAEVADGTYDLIPSTLGGKLVGYGVAFSPKGAGWRDSRKIGSAGTLDEGKAIAQRDYDSRRRDGEAHDPDTKTP